MIISSLGFYPLAAVFDTLDTFIHPEARRIASLLENVKIVVMK